MKKLWAGRFSGNIDELAEAFNASIDYDQKLYRYDILGSIAHAKMLCKCGLISEEETLKIVEGLASIEKEIEKGELEFTYEKEDIHTHIEARLIEKIGAIGEKLHTARSRNDQIALDIRLYSKEEVMEIISLIELIENSLLELAEKNVEVIIPGFTHLQHAQPILFSHHILAYLNMLERDKERLQDTYKRVNILPLGSGALAGTSLPIDRNFVAAELGFAKVYDNSMDAVSDRDFIIEILSNIAILGMHISRLSEELILWMSKEYSFIDIGEGFCTGSSLMPQKKNPDMAELARGKTGRFYGNLISLLTTMKGLPLAYNKDMQEDKEPLFDSIDNIKSILAVYAEMLKTVTVNTAGIEKFLEDEFLLATDMVEYLVKKGEAFRVAHGIIGNIVAFVIKEDRIISELSLNELKEYSDKFENDVFELLNYRESVKAKISFGSTGVEEVKKTIIEWREKLNNA